MAREILQQSFRVGIYARVSTPDGKGQSPEMQLRELREHCERRGWQMVGEYVDRMTGSKDSRPELDRLMADAHKRRFDVVIVWKFDRFARSVSHLYARWRRSKPWELSSCPSPSNSTHPPPPASWFLRFWVQLPSWNAV